MTAKPDLDQPTTRHNGGHPDLDRMVSEFEAKRAAPKAQAEEPDRALCHECQRSFALPAVVRCPFDDCGSTQIGRVSPIDGAIVKLRQLAARLSSHADEERADGKYGAEERWRMRAKGVEDAIEELTGKKG